MQDPEFSREFRRAADEMLAQRYASIARSPGTGKARLLELVHSQNETVALKALALYYGQTAPQMEAVRQRATRNETDEIPEELARAIGDLLRPEPPRDATTP